jgi:hypothetical protein
MPLVEPVLVSRTVFYLGSRLCHSVCDELAGLGFLVLTNCALILLVSKKDAWLRRTTLIGLAAKIVASALYISMVVRIYDYASDMPRYFNQAWLLGSTYQWAGRIPVPDPLWGTNFVGFITDVAGVFLMGGPSLPIAEVGCGIPGFWGAYFLYRAFCVAFPQARQKPAVLVLPSLSGFLDFTHWQGRNHSLRYPTASPWSTARRPCWDTLCYRRECWSP